MPVATQWSQQAGEHRVDAVFRAAPDALKAVVSGFHHLTIGAGGPPLSDRMLPHWANIRLTLQGSWSNRIGDAAFDPVPEIALTGPTSRLSHSRCGGAVIVGFGVTPLGWTRITGKHAFRFADRMVDLGELVASDVDLLLRTAREADDPAGRFAILDAWCATHLLRPGRPEQHRVTMLHRLFNDSAFASVDAVAAAAGISARQLWREAMRAFGLPPQLLLRRQRFLRTLQAVRAAPPGIAGALDEQYFDQAHFTRDCHRFLGMPLTAFLAQPRPVLQALLDARERSIGAPIAGIQPPA